MIRSLIRPSPRVAVRQLGVGGSNSTGSKPTEALPFGDSESDVVTSSFGAIVAPNHNAVAPTSGGDGVAESPCGSRGSRGCAAAASADQERRAPAGATPATVNPPRQRGRPWRRSLACTQACTTRVTFWSGPPWGLLGRMASAAALRSFGPVHAWVLVHARTSKTIGRPRQRRALRSRRRTLTRPARSRYVATWSGGMPIHPSDGMGGDVVV